MIYLRVRGNSSLQGATGLPFKQHPVAQSQGWVETVGVCSDYAGGETKVDTSVKKFLKASRLFALLPWCSQIESSAVTETCFDIFYCWLPWSSMLYLAFLVTSRPILQLAVGPGSHCFSFSRRAWSPGNTGFSSCSSPGSRAQAQ